MLKIENDQFHLTKLEQLNISASAREIKELVRKQIRHCQLGDLLLETHAWTGFLSAFTRLTTGRPITEADESHQVALLACLIAEGCNIGLSDMSVNNPGLSFSLMDEVKASYLRDETLAKATAVLVNFQLQQPLAGVWGQGESSSSDGRVYGVRVLALNATFNPKYFASAGRGISVYTHVADTWIPFYTQVITCNARQAPYVIDGLLYHGTQLQPREHYTDTHGLMVIWTLSDEKTNLLTCPESISGGNTSCRLDVCKAILIILSLLNSSMMMKGLSKLFRVSYIIY